MNIVNRFLSKITFLKSTNLYQFTQEIGYSFVIKTISKVFSNKVDTNLILLSAYGGKAFIDNTKYIFQYLVKNTEYKVIWITNSRNLLKELKAKGYQAVYKFELNTIKLLRKAKFIFTTHGVFDVLPIDFSPNTIFVCTWHGVQNKRNSSVHGPIKYGKLAKYLKLKIVNDSFINYFVTPSGTKKDKKLIVNYFQISPTKIITTGYPRNDILFSKDLELKTQIRRKYKISKIFKRILLYAPTFRDISLTAKLPLNQEELIELNYVLKRSNSILIMKAHMFEKIIEFKNYSNIKKALKNTDIQELLCITDILITDYSSVYCDFLLLNKPILLFTYDFEEFMKKGRGFYYDFKQIAPGPLLFTGKDLIKAIKNVDNIEKDFEERRLKTMKLYHKNIDGNSTERLLKFLKII